MASHNDNQQDYLLPNGTLKNMLGVDSAKLLATTEYKLTTNRQRQLELNDFYLPNGTQIAGKQFDEVLQLHKYLFDGIYEWAGQFRTVDMAKETSFLEAQFLPTAVGELQNDFDNFQKVLIGNRHDVAEKLGKSISDCNFMHPFREGNGRTQRILAKAMAKSKGFNFTLDPQETSATAVYREYMDASIADDPRLMIEVFEKHLQRSTAEINGGLFKHQAFNPIDRNR